MATLRSTLILPVETQVRELDAKILLSCVAAERGFPVLMGSRAYVHYKVGSMPRGVYLAKSMRQLSDRMFDLLRRLGHEIVAWDEEGLVRYDASAYTGRRLSARAVGNCSRLLAWGSDDARIFSEFPGAAGIPVHVTGNPRIDLMRPELRSTFEPEADALRRRYGNLVLVNTNFGFVNAFVSSLNLLEPGRPGLPPRPGKNARGMTPEFAAGVAAHKRALFERFQALVPVLAEALPDHSIVVRPHPTESPLPWQRAAEAHPNVFVTNENTVIPWLMAAKLLVHNGCTTAVEAAVLGTPAVAYQPVRSQEYDLHLPNSLSLRASTAEELREVVQDLASGRTKPDGAGVRRVLERHVASLEGPLAADRIVDVLEEAGYADAAPPAPPRRERLRARGRLLHRTLSKRINTWIPQHRNNARYHKHRFPGITVEQLRERIDRFDRQLGRFKHLRVERFDDHIFHIERR